MHSGLALWFLGYPQAAFERCHSGLALAKDLSHPHSIANALPVMGIVHQLRGDVEGTREVAEALIALSSDHGFQQWLAFGRVLDDWVLTLQGGAEATIARLHQHIAEYGATGTHLFDSFLSLLLAAAQLSCGQAGEALHTVVAALEMTQTTESPLWAPELCRLKGELLLARDPDAGPAAEIAFRQAIDIARQQSAKSWELRAATSLARLLSRQGKQDEARRRLADIHDWFVEGFDTADLREAKRLLDQISTGST